VGKSLRGTGVSRPPNGEGRASRSYLPDFLAAAFFAGAFFTVFAATAFAAGFAAGFFAVTVFLATVFFAAGFFAAAAGFAAAFFAAGFAAGFAAAFAAGFAAAFAAGFAAAFFAGAFAAGFAAAALVGALLLAIQFLLSPGLGPTASGLVMRLGYAHYILGVKGFYASSAGGSSTDRRARGLERARESIKLFPRGAAGRGSAPLAEDGQERGESL